MKDNSTLLNIHPNEHEIRKAVTVLNTIHQKDENKRKKRLMKIIPELQAVNLEEVSDQYLLFICCIVYVQENSDFFHISTILS